MEQTQENRTRVLVVDDQYLIAMDLVCMLEQLGYSPVGPAASVAEALATLARDGADLALLDETLAGESALPVAMRLQEQGIPFVVVSGHVRSISGNPLLQAARRLEKPLTNKRLAETLMLLRDARK
ncbi:response regulator [Cereibacter azotoformans]|uniref:Signal transduction histidine kinase n=1 Tax=Cereibacter sphaeroides (strain ATCC 17025 / ATH 2.4.3) TaxID=349102 RepID=A4WYB6_CERS5|nr:response regulator [Cereibacter azotoformans]ULB11816.1 response regulator [Cereibacter azotoformans]